MKNFIVKCQDCSYKKTFEELWDAEEDRQDHENKNDHIVDLEEIE